MWVLPVLWPGFGGGPPCRREPSGGAPRAPGSPLTGAEREQLLPDLAALELGAINLD